MKALLASTITVILIEQVKDGENSPSFFISHIDKTAITVYTVHIQLAR